MNREKMLKSPGFDQPLIDGSYSQIVLRFPKYQTVLHLNEKGIDIYQNDLLIDEKDSRISSILKEMEKLNLPRSTETKDKYFERFNVVLSKMSMKSSFILQQVIDNLERNIRIPESEEILFRFRVLKIKPNNVPLDKLYEQAEIEEMDQKIFQYYFEIENLLRLDRMTIQQLPNEIQYQILSYLEPNDIFQYLETNKWSKNFIEQYYSELVRKKFKEDEIILEFNNKESLLSNHLLKLFDLREVDLSHSSHSLLSGTIFVAKVEGLRYKDLWDGEVSLIISAYQRYGYDASEIIYLQTNFKYGKKDGYSYFRTKSYESENYLRIDKYQENNLLNRLIFGATSPKPRIFILSYNENGFPYEMITSSPSLTFTQLYQKYPEILPEEIDLEIFIEKVKLDQHSLYTYTSQTSFLFRNDTEREGYRLEQVYDVKYINDQFIISLYEQYPSLLSSIARKYISLDLYDSIIYFDPQNGQIHAIYNKEFQTRRKYFVSQTSVVRSLPFFISENIIQKYLL